MILINEIQVVEINSKEIILINLTNGLADVLEKDIWEAILEGEYRNICNEIIHTLIERNYIFHNNNSYQKYIKNLNIELSDSMINQTPNFIYVSNYDCNLKCYYCFQEAFDKNHNCTSVRDEKDVKIVYNTIKKIIDVCEQRSGKTFNPQDINVDITGGEPLLERNYTFIDNFMKSGYENDYNLGIVSNGTTLDRYLSLLRNFPNCSLQVTLDGSKNVHDGIRVYKTGEKTFDKIVDNVIELSKVNDNISIRINISNKNIHSIEKIGDLIQKHQNIEFYAYLMQQEGCSDTINIINEFDGLKYLEKKKEDYPNLEDLYISYHGHLLIENIFGNGYFKPKIAICNAMYNGYIKPHQPLAKIS